MVAIDGSMALSHPAGAGRRTGTIVLAAAAGAVLAALAGAVFDPIDGTGWTVAAVTASRVSSLIFVTALIAEPLSRLAPSSFTRTVAAERDGLLLGFIASAALALTFELVPSLSGDAIMADTTIVYCGFTGAILAILFFTSHPAVDRILGRPARRAMLRIAIGYFWTVFLFTGIGHMIGPHRPDHWNGFSVLMLVGAIFVRFADAYRRQVLAEKVA